MNDDNYPHPPMPPLPAEQQKAGSGSNVDCLRCSTPMILCNVNADARGSYGWINLSPTGKRKMLNKARGSASVALVCPNCGYTELRALNPEQLHPYE